VNGTENCAAILACATRYNKKRSGKDEEDPRALLEGCQLGHRCVRGNLESRASSWRCLGLDALDLGGTRGGAFRYDAVRKATYVHRGRMPGTKTRRDEGIKENSPRAAWETVGEDRRQEQTDVTDIRKPGLRSDV